MTVVSTYSYRRSFFAPSARFCLSVATSWSGDGGAGAILRRRDEMAEPPAMTASNARCLSLITLPRAFRRHHRHCATCHRHHRSAGSRWADAVPLRTDPISLCVLRLLRARGSRWPLASIDGARSGACAWCSVAGARRIARAQLSCGVADAVSFHPPFSHFASRRPISCRRCHRGLRTSPLPLTPAKLFPPTPPVRLIALPPPLPGSRARGAAVVGVAARCRPAVARETAV